MSKWADWDLDTTADLYGLDPYHGGPDYVRGHPDLEDAIRSQAEKLKKEGKESEASRLLEGYEEDKREFLERRSKSSNNGGCFVATAVYQNPHAENVELYRWFRDNVLVNSERGKRFVDWYQNGGGQRLSQIVENHPILRVPSKAALDIGAYAIGAYKNYVEKATQNH